MNIKTAVTAALILFFIATGNILSFGLLDASSFQAIYLVFALICIGLIISSISSMLSRSDLLLAVMLGVLISVPLIFFAVTVKTNYESTKTLSIQEQNLMAEMNNISANNEYYANYVSYVNGQISQYEKNTLLLESEIRQKMAEIADKKKAAVIENQTVVQPPPEQVIPVEVPPEEIPVPVPPYDNDYRERDGEYDD